MSFDEVRLRRNGSSVIQTMLKRLTEEEGREEARQEVQEEVQEEDQEQPLGLNTVRTVPVETAKPLTNAALY
jgi:Arc/MetJ-type ribon-helix-helix transcriptional regulator